MLRTMRQLILKEFRESFDLNRGSVQQIPRDQLTILWFDDYYDGMLSGILEHSGQKLRFEIITDYSQNIHPRTFAIISLTEKQLDEETSRHELFKNHVGDYKNKIYRPKTEHHLYFDKISESEKSDYESSFVYGWFID